MPGMSPVRFVIRSEVFVLEYDIIIVISQHSVMKNILRVQGFMQELADENLKKVTSWL